MTAITLSSDLPSELVTLEKLTYHNCLALNFLYSNQQIALNEENKQFPKSNIQTGRALDGKLYSVVTQVFEMDETIVQSNPIPITKNLGWPLWIGVLYQSLPRSNKIAPRNNHGIRSILIFPTAIGKPVNKGFQ